MAGQRMLVEGGVRSVKLIPLAETAGLTSGSFYHHFASMPEFFEELAQFFADGSVTEALSEIDDRDPIARLRRLNRALKDNRTLPLNQAMRDWAGSDRAAAEAVEAADATTLQFIERAFLDMGATRRDARARALLLFSAAGRSSKVAMVRSGRRLRSSAQGADPTDLGPSGPPTGT